MSKIRLHSVIQRYNLNPPEGKILADKNQTWWEQQTFSDLTGFQVECDLEIVAHLEPQKATIDQKLAEMSNTEPWADDIVYLMQIPGFGIIFSMIVLSAIGDVTRFTHPKQLVGYAGLGAGCTTVVKNIRTKRLPKKAVANCVGPWWKHPGVLSAAIPIGRRNTNT